jgi:TonB-dependent Receptor Plug Domain
MPLILCIPRRILRCIRSHSLAFAVGVMTVCVAGGAQPQTLRDALREFQAAGVRIIFSSRTVPPTLMASGAPTGATTEQKLRSLLSPHNLDLLPLSGGGWAVIAKTASAADSTAESPGIQPPAHLAEILVQSSREALIAPQQAGTIERDRAAVSAAPATDEDIIRSLQQIPGTVADGFSARTHVRGSRNDETLIRYDGIPLVGPFHFKDFQTLFGAIDPAAVDSVGYWTGAYPVDYGGAIGGVMDIVPRQVTHRITEIGLSSLNTSLVYGTTFAASQGSVLLSARKSNLAHVADTLKNEIGTPEFQDFLLRSTWLFGDGTNLTVGALALDDVISLSAVQPAQQARARYRDLYAWLKLAHQWGANIRNETILSIADLNSDRDVSVDRPQINIGNLAETKHSTLNTLRDELTIAPSNQLNARLGAEYSRAAKDYGIEDNAQYFAPFVTAIRPNHVKNQSMNLSAQYSTQTFYASSRWQPFAKSVLEFGARRDEQSFPHEDLSQWNSRASLWQRLDATTAVTLAWGQYSQPLSINGIPVADGVTNLRSVRRLTESSIGIEHAFAHGLTLRVDAYDKREKSPNLSFENIFSYLVLAPEIEVDRKAVQSSEGQMRGLEITLESDRSKPLSGFFTYVHSRALNMIGGAWIPRSWDQPDAVTTGLRWSHGAWQLSSVFSIHSGWPYTPLLASSTTWTDPNTANLQLAPRNSARWRNFRSLDLYAVWQHPLGHGTLEATVELRNALNADNPCCREYQVSTDMAGNSTLTQNTQEWLPLTPIIGIRWKR